MPTTITLTPTLTLIVADRRMQQSSIESVWDTITQHIRATGRPTHVAVLDGTETLRQWKIAPDGTRTPVDLDPTTAAPEAPFRLVLSPWMMSVPRPDGPDVREVSTLAVARAQATEAATAGDVELILQTTGTDDDTAETIEPDSPEQVTATHALDDEENLFAELENVEDTTVEEDTRRFRRRAVIGSCALGLFLLSGIGAAGWSALNPPAATEPQPVKAAPSESTDDATDAAADEAMEFQSDAVAPAGFSGTPAWEVVGATDQSSGMTWTGQHVGAVSGRALDVVNTSDGQVTESVTLPATPESGPYPLRDSGNGGLLLPGEDRVMTWSEDHGLVETKISEKNRLVIRGTTAFIVPQNDDTRPDAIQVVTTDGLTKYTSPDASAAPIGPTDNGAFLWASNAEGGSLIRATASGQESSSTRLIGPSKGTTISKWIGANEDYAAAIWSNDGSGNVLAIHDAATGKVVDTEDLGSTGAGAGMKIVPSTDGRHIIAGTSLIDLEDGKAAGTVEIGTSSSQTVQAVPGGWIAAQADGTQFLITADGDSLDSPEPTESLLGLTGAGNVVVDNRGTIAAFTPDPDGED